MPEAGPRYWAVLSYSHADIRWGRRLHRALEGYVVPRRLVGRPTPAGPAPRRLRPIFRDQDEMGAGGSLSDRLKAALDKSDCLIVVCSPAAVGSPWVNEEIRRFKAERGEDRILAVIVAGEPFASERAGDEAQECFPKALRHRFADGERIEPIAADLRPGRDSLRAAVLKLVAGVLDVQLDELVQRDAARRNRQLVALTSVFGATAALMTTLAVAAIAERNEARRERSQAEGLVEFMIGDLKDKLQPAGRLDILDAIGARAKAYYAGQNSGRLDAASLGQRARVLQLLGNIKFQRGEFPEAMSLFQQAASSTGEVLRRRPDDPQAIFNHAQSVGYMGEVAMKTRDVATALREFTDYQGLARRLAAIDPSNLDWQVEVEEADTDLGAALLNQARPDDAARAFQDALAISRRLAAAPGAKRAWRWTEAQSLAWLADTELARGRLDEALGHRLEEGRIYATLIAASPHDNEAAVGLASNRREVARIQLARGDAASAAAVLTAAVADIEPLVSAAPDNGDYASNFEPIVRLLAQAQLQRGQLAAAAVNANRAIHLCEAQVMAADARHDEALMWRGARLGAARLVALKIAAAGARTRAAQRQALQGAPAEAARLRAVLARHPQDRGLALATAETVLLAGDFEASDGDMASARTDWAWSLRVLQQTPQTIADTDRRPMVLRQAGYRLSLSQPPTGPLGPGPVGSSGPGRVAPVSKGPSPPADYRW